MQKNSRKLLRVPQVVQYLDGVAKESTVRGWILREEIDVVRIGNGVVCIPVEALEDMIQRGSCPCRSPRPANSRTTTRRKSVSA